MFGSKGDPGRRLIKLLALSLVFCGLGVFFFVRSSLPTGELQVTSVSTSASLPKSVSGSPKHYVSGPDPEVFKTFTYDSDLPIYTVEGKCRNTYYVVLIYAASLDYRESPLDAKYNVATACPATGSFSQQIRLGELHLVPGDLYYVIKADMGSTGQWYNPY